MAAPETNLSASDNPATQDEQGAALRVKSSVMSLGAGTPVSFSTPSVCPQTGLVRWAHELRPDGQGTSMVLLESRPVLGAASVETASTEPDDLLRRKVPARAWLDVVAQNHATPWHQSSAGQAWAAARDTQQPCVEQGTQLDALQEAPSATDDHNPQDLGALARAALDALRAQGAAFADLATVEELELDRLPADAERSDSLASSQRNMHPRQR